MTRCRAIAAAALVVLLGQRVSAFDQVVHHAVIYAVAIANGLSAADATVVADASYSLDENDTTTAFSWGLIKHELAALPPRQLSTARERLAGLPEALTELPHMRSGQVFHALTSDNNRIAIERAHLARIRRVQSDASEPGTAEEKRLRALMYFGQYLHFAADLVVHPNDPLLGHALEGHLPDRGDLGSDKMQIAIALLNQKVKEFQSGGIQPTRQEDLTRFPRTLDPRPQTDYQLRRVAGAVVSSWARTYASEGNTRGRPGADADNDRTMRATSEIGRVMNTAVPRFHNIALDGDGEPLGSTRFGSSRRLDVLPFASTLEGQDALREERKYAVAVQLGRSLGAKAIDTAVAGVAEAVDNARRAAVWSPPSSPGGVALNPRLTLPRALGAARRITLDADTLILEAAQGKYAFDGVSARSFATIARTIAAGQIPYLTIGTDPSDLPGYAKVTYSPALDGTAEGAALYQADIQFKGIFARMPFGDGYQLDPVTSALVTGFPEGGVDSVRLWITSSDIALREQGGRLVAVDHGMRILSETRLRFVIRDDPEMDAYTRKLTDHWNELADRISAFRSVELLARATAIAFWARDHNVEIDPVLLMLPRKGGVTPSHARVIGRPDSGGGVLLTGGVSLTPEDKRTSLGRVLLSYLSATLSQGDQDGAVPYAGRLGLLVLAVFLIASSGLIPAGLLWLVARAALRGAGVRLPYRVALRVWWTACLTEIALVAILSPLLFGEWLSLFDRNLLALAATAGAFPVILLSLIRREGARAAYLDTVLRGRPGLRAIAVLLAMVGPISAGQLGAAAACVTMALTNPVPTPTLNAIMTYQIAPIEALLSGLLTPGEHATLPVPQSLMETFQPPFETHHYPVVSGDRVAAGSQQIDPTLPFETLERIAWPAGVPQPSGGPRYSVDGQPPF